MNYTFIILGIILVIILWLLYVSLLPATSIASAQTYLKDKPAPVLTTKLTNPNSTNFYYSVWVYVNNLNSGTNITMPETLSQPSKIRDTKSSPNNIFYLVDSNNNAYLSLDITSSTLLNTSILMDSPGMALRQYDLTPNFPLQRWEHIIISINQNYMDLYLDGKLIKSANLGKNPTLPILNTTAPASIQFGNGDIYIAGFQRVPNAIDPQAAWNLYLNGSGTARSTFNYSLQMQLSKNNEKQSTVKFF